MVLTLKANPTREKHVNLCLPYYNCWQGANEAVNEFFIKNNLDKKDIVSVDHSCSIYQKVGIV